MDWRHRLAAFIAGDRSSWERYSLDRQSKRFTAVLVHAGEASLQWNPAYWRGVEQKIDFANDAGLVVCVTAVREAGPGFPAADPARSSCSVGTSRPGSWEASSFTRPSRMTWPRWNWGLTTEESTVGWPSDVALAQPSSTHMKYLAEFLRGIQWWSLEPAHALIKNQPTDWTQRMAMAKSARGDLAVAYLPENERIVIDLRELPIRLKATWFDPTRNQYLGVPGAIDCATEVTLENPPSWADAVLLLKRAGPIRERGGNRRRTK